MNEELPTMILLNIMSDTQQLETMEEELLYQVILSPIGSIILLAEHMRELTLNTETLKLPET